MTISKMMIIAAVAPPGRPPLGCMFSPVLFPETLNEVGAIVGKEGPSIVDGVELNVVVFMVVDWSVVSSVVVCIVGVGSSTVTCVRVSFHVVCEMQFHNK